MGGLIDPGTTRHGERYDGLGKIVRSLGGDGAVAELDG